MPIFNHIDCLGLLLYPLCMLDLKFIKENAEAVKKNVADRFMTVDVDRVIELYDRRNALITEVDSLRQKRNENAKKMKGPMDQVV